MTSSAAPRTWGPASAGPGSAGTGDPAAVPPELLGAVPRDVRLTPGGLVVASLAVAAAVGALVAGIVLSVVYEPTGFPVWAIPLTVASLLVVAAALVWSLRRQWILLSEGRAARARVTALKKVSSDKGKRYRVSYEFQTLSGALQRSRCEIGKAPAIGAIIPVVYHRERPEWSATYPLRLVRPSRLVS